MAFNSDRAGDFAASPTKGFKMVVYWRKGDRGISIKILKMLIVFWCHRRSDFTGIDFYVTAAAKHVIAD